MPSDDTGVKRPSPLQALGSTPLRRTLTVVLLLAGTYLLIPRLTGAGDTLKLLRQADGRYLLAAVLLQLTSLFWIGYIVYRAVPAFGPAVPLGWMLQLVLASQFTSTFIPSAGLSGIALRARFFGERGCRMETTLASYAVETLTHALAIATTTTVAMLALTTLQGGAPWWLLALLVAPMIVGVTILAKVLADPRPGDWRYRVLGWVNRGLARLGRPPLPATALEERLAGVRLAIRTLSGPLRLRLYGAGLGRIVADILCLHVTLLAFGQAVPLHLTALNYGLSNVLAYLSSSPGGLLVTEGSLAFGLAQQGVSLSLATAAILTYRLFSFWLPRILGLATLLNLQRQSSRPLW